MAEPTLQATGSCSYDHYAINYVSYIAGFLYSALILWILNVESDDIKQSLQSIKQKIGDLVVAESFVEINGKYHLETYARSHIISMLNEFQGMDAYGYVTLGKPLLTSIFANFITYLIILIQFKISGV